MRKQLNQPNLVGERSEVSQNVVLQLRISADYDLYSNNATLTINLTYICAYICMCSIRKHGLVGGEFNCFTLHYVCMYCMYLSQKRQHAEQYIYIYFFCMSFCSESCDSHASLTFKFTIDDVDLFLIDYALTNKPIRHTYTHTYIHACINIAAAC